MERDVYILSAIAVSGIITFLIRALPFILSKTGTFEEKFGFLKEKLPASIMIILAIFNVRNMITTSLNFNLDLAISIIVAIVTQKKLKNTSLTVVAATIVYMFLIRL